LFFKHADNRTPSLNKRKKKTPTKMNTHTNTPRIIRSGLALALALTVWSPIQSRSEEPAKEKMKMEGKKMMGGKMMTDADMMQHCEAMKEMKEKMAADLKTQDAELTAQISEMNSASEDKKLGLMAGIITQMASQRTAMNEHKAKMEEEMMQHMMEHMQMGKESMAQCPMMKGIKGSDDKSDDAHKEHHKEKE